MALRVGARYFHGMDPSASEVEIEIGRLRQELGDPCARKRTRFSRTTRLQAMVVLTMVTWATGCAGRMPVALHAPLDVRQMWVETTSRQSYDLRNPSIEGDSVIVGFDERSRTRVRIPLGEVVSAESDGTGSGGAITLAVIAAGVVGALWIFTGAWRS